MIIILRRLSAVLALFAFSWLLHLAIPGKIGYVVCGLFFLIGLVLILFIKQDYKWDSLRPIPLLFYFLCFILGTILLFQKSLAPLMPFFISASVSSFLGIVLWFYERKYKKKTINQVLSEEVTLPPVIDFLLLVSAIVDLFKGRFPIWLCIVVIVLVSFDLIRHLNATSISGAPKNSSKNQSEID